MSGGETVLQIVTSALIVFFIGITLEAPKKILPYLLLTGSTVWLVFLICQTFLSKIGAVFAASLFIAWLSHWLSRLLKKPVTVFFIPSLIPLVPGRTMFLSVQAFTQQQFVQAQMLLLEAIQIAGVIALSLFLMDSLFSLFVRIKNRRGHKKVS